MKKAKFPAFLVTCLICFVFWLLITGEISGLFDGIDSGDIEILVAGAAVSILAALFSARFFIHEKAFYLLNPRRFFCLLLYCLIIFPWELIKANVDMACRAFAPKKNLKPGIVKIPSALTSEYGLSMLANSITLTPGTITMDIVEENGKNWYYIHWINAAEQDAEKAGAAIKGTMEKWIRRIWE
ncbi:MAG: Na+/H+ antiporter subunit E [Lachnospiraceae bacterium]|nr:Na+/H+ antiporter subunit E [Lachnospiraceae bacterium]